MVKITSFYRISFVSCTHAKHRTKCSPTGEQITHMSIKETKLSETLNQLNQLRFTRLKHNALVTPAGQNGDAKMQKLSPTCINSSFLLRKIVVEILKYFETVRT